MTSRHPTTILCLFLLLLSVPPLWADENATDIWAAREQARYNGERQALLHKEQQALQARAQAETARQYALQLKDNQALPIAEKALTTADRALERIRSALQKTDKRLESVERLRRAHAGDFHAVAGSVRGTVEIKTLKGWKTLSSDDILGPGELIRTGSDGFAEVMFDDGSRVNLHANSSFMLESRDGESSDYKLSLGRIKAQIERLGRRRYAVRTPTSVAGVRGTEFLLETTAEGDSALVVLRGEVEFGPAGKEQRISVHTGERAMLAADGSLRGPEPFDLKTLQPWWD